MPCFDARNEPDNVRREALEDFTHNSPVAELLCEAMDKLYELIPLCRYKTRLSPQLLEWYSDHLARDRAKRSKK